MPLIITELLLPLEAEETTLKELAARAAGVRVSDIKSFKLMRMSLDARKKTSIAHNCSVLLTLSAADEARALKRALKNISAAPKEEASAPRFGEKKLEKPVVVVGMGPAGLFAAYGLALEGYRPIVVERGKRVEERAKDVSRLFDSGMLESESNVMFGEGGAGAFSDGKLTTRVKDARASEVLRVLHAHGAPEDILYKAKPHVGTDMLLKTIRALREKLTELGAELRFSTKLVDYEECEGAISAVMLETGAAHERVECSAVVLAIGQGARDTYELLRKKGMDLQPKAFAVGVRIEHPRKLIDEAQFGAFSGHARLGAAEYQLADSFNGRGVYTFCMCPGGVVVASASGEGQAVVNGMSYRARNGENSNAAIVVQVSPQDFGFSPLDGVRFQERLEHSAYALGGGGFIAPASRVRDFLENKEPRGFGTVKPSYRPGVVPKNLRLCLPDFVTDAVAHGIKAFARKLKGFDMHDAVLTAVESRTSAPLRIVRDEAMQAARLKGLYPIGEGAGYAGGIVSAAVDGLKAAEAVMALYGPPDRM